MKVVLAYPYTDDKGKEHAPDSTIDLPEDVARDRVHYGWARWPEDDTKTTKSPASGAEKKD